MRIFPVSDLHFDVNGTIVQHLFEDAVKKLNPDLIIVAGDVFEGVVNSLKYLEENCRGIPVLFTAGNHEWYGYDMTEERKRAHDYADECHNVVWLDDSSHIFQGVKFVGGSLWTDFELDGTAHKYGSQICAQKGMNDYYHIKKDGKRLTPFDTVDLFRETEAFIRADLEAPQETEKTVVVTHHAPSPRSLSPLYQNSLLNPAFASDLTDLVAKADFWIHGHVHHYNDYMVDKCQVICNPYGYERYDPSNPAALSTILEV